MKDQNTERRLPNITETSSWDDEGVSTIANVAGHRILGQNGVGHACLDACSRCQR